MIAHPRRIFSLGIILMLLFLAACNASPEQTATNVPTDTLPAPEVHVTPAPDVLSASLAFFEAWRLGDYETMYGMLSEQSRAALNQEDFTKTYQDNAIQMALDDIAYELGNATVSPSKADVEYTASIRSSLLGDLNTSGILPFVKEAGSWRLNWSPGLILPQLSDGSKLRLDILAPERGRILDRNGDLLAGTLEAAAVGLYPDYMEPDRAGSILSLLARLTGQSVDQIESRYINYAPGTVGYLQLGEVPLAENSNLIEILSGASGVVLEPYTARFYPGSGAAPHVVGYVSSLQQGAEAEEYVRKGYRVDASIGRTGIENWGESILAGKNGATLYRVDAEGKPVEILGEAAMEPSQVITTTLEADFQDGVQQAIAGMTGAAVVLERDTGRVLAMASSPGFDPNAYQTANFNWSTLVSEIGSDPNQPLYNRATQGQYPLGSVFKLITASAGLESGLFTPRSTYDCQYIFEEIPGSPLIDWTYEYFQEDGVTLPSGVLTLPQGIIRSCNPWFYKIGMELFKAGQGKRISELARAFGLGQKTGIEGVEEEAGNIPDPNALLDATNIAIGQGDVLVTPLQVARFIAAIGNGGTLFRPQLIETIAGQDGVPTFQFKPDATGQLPVSPENLQIIQDAMLGVTTSKNPQGTALYTFNGFDITVHGKTGTATTSNGDPHAWFAGYTNENRPGRPDIAVAVILENQGQGSVWAAPVFRRVLELYFNGRPGRLYHWEKTYNITETPTPYGFELTPTPEE
jgi:penicillin-binding protein 2